MGKLFNYATGHKSYEEHIMTGLKRGKKTRILVGKVDQCLNLSQMTG